MVLIKDKIRELVEKAVKSAFPDIKLEVKIEYPTVAVHGDYACAIALELVKKVKKVPRVIAEEIVEAIKKPDWIKQISIAGPGFINFFLTPEFLSEFLGEIKKLSGEFGIGSTNSKKTVVIDFSQPNIAKPLGIHHLLSTIIGQSLYNIHKFLGFKTVGVNHIGDWGTQFGKLSYAYRKWGDKKAVKANPISELLKLYVKFHEEAGKDPALEESGRAEFKKLEQGDAENTKLWKWFCEVSMEEVQKTYDYLGGIHFDYTQGESFYEDKMAPILERGKTEKIFVKGKEGSWVVQFENNKYPPYLVQKSDGATLYSTRDLAAIDYREKTWHPEKILYVVDVAQSLHFQQLFETAKLLNLAHAQLVHVVFGRMQFKNKKMSTRKGNIILLDEVLKEAVAKARAIVEEKNPDLSGQKKDEVAHQVGVGAVKYAALSQNRTTNIIFDWDKMLSLEGNSAPYLQYVHARACSILRKAKEAGAGEGKQAKYILKEPQELNLARLLPKFPEVVLLAAQEFKPNLITTYLFELAGSFNSFYAAVPVLKGEKSAMEVRLKLIEAVILTLKNGLKLLGIEAPEEM